MIKWGLILALFLGLSLTIFYTGQSISLVGFEAGLLALNMSVGVLAINFSIMAYQNSEYRQFQQGLSPNFLAGLMLTLAWVMVPICCLVFNRSQVGLIALSSIPVTGLLSLVLVALAKKEGDASSLIHQLTDSKKWKRAFQKYGKNVAEQKKFWDQMGISIPDGMPTHEWSWTPLPPPLKTDPFALLGSIGCVAAKSSNAVVVIEVAKALLRAQQEFHIILNSSGEKPIRGADILVDSQLERLCHAVEASDPTGFVAERFLDVCAKHLMDLIKKPSPRAYPFFKVVHLMGSSSERWIARKHSHVARCTLIAIRQCCLKGVLADVAFSREEEVDVDALYWDHYLGMLAASLKPLGVSAIKAGETNFLYLVFEAYGWLGCSALKRQNREVVKECLRALTHLGRYVARPPKTIAIAELV